MSRLQLELSRYGEDPIVQAATAVWNHLPAVIGYNIVFAACTLVPLVLMAGGLIIPAVLTAAILIGGAWGIILDAAAQMVTGRAHLALRTMRGSARFGIMLALPFAAATLALHAAWQMGSTAPGSWLRIAAIGTDLLVIGSLFVVLPAAGAGIETPRPRFTTRWTAAAELTGRKPVQTLECLGLLGALAWLGMSYPLIVLLLGPSLVALFAAASFAPISTTNPD